MTLEYIRAIALVMAFVLFAILVAKWISEPITPMTINPRVVKTLVVNVDDELDKQWGGQ